MDLLKKKVRSKMPVIKSPFPDHDTLCVKNNQSEMIVEIASLSAGLEFALNSLKKGQITKAAKEQLSELISQTYLLYTRKIALRILQDEDCVKKDTELVNVSIHFDLPDEHHDDLIIFYKVIS